MKIDYLGHSGFFVETDSVLLLFDYYYGDLSFIGQKLTKSRFLYLRAMFMRITITLRSSLFRTFTPNDLSSVI